MVAYHRLPPSVLDLLAAGDCDVRTVELLRRTRYSRLLLVVCDLLQSGERLAEVTNVLCDAQVTAPQEFAETLTYPWVAAWAVGMCRRQENTRDRNHLRAVAAAASLRAGAAEVPLRLSAHREGGRVVLPSLGSLGAQNRSTVRITRADLGGPRWSEVCRLDLRVGSSCVQMTIDDIDPYRACQRGTNAQRLTPAALARWREMLIESWQLLAAHSPAQCAELACGLKSVVPLRSKDPAMCVSLTHRDAFGGFAANLPADACELAATMIHEFQHSKLNAVLDLLRLYSSDDERWYFAPWRPDPRPLGGLLHGVYAFIAVAEFWHALRSNIELEERATRRFAMLRVQVSRALADLVMAPGLTRIGQRFAMGLTGWISRLDHPIPQDIERHAVKQLNGIERAWRDRHDLGTRPEART